MPKRFTPTLSTSLIVHAHIYCVPTEWSGPALAAVQGLDLEHRVGRHHVAQWCVRSDGQPLAAAWVVSAGQSWP